VYYIVTMRMVTVAGCLAMLQANHILVLALLLLLLLQVSSPEQRQLEVQLDSTRQLIKLQHYCQVGGV
jgi:hypothetical protein